MSEFQVGKRVLCVNVDGTDIVNNADLLINRVGKIVKIYSEADLDMTVDFGKGGKGTWHLNFENVKLLD